MFLFKHIMRAEVYYKERWTEHRTGEYEMARLGMKKKVFSCQYSEILR